jgi:hypothetical protein
MRERVGFTFSIMHRIEDHVLAVVPAMCGDGAALRDFTGVVYAVARGFSVG